MIFIILSVGVLFFSGCARYQRQQPLHIQWLEENSKKQKDVEIRTKALTGKKCRKYFGRNLVKRGYQPIKIEIKNSSTNAYALSPRSISLPLSNAYQVYKNTKRHSSRRFIRYWGLTALVMLPVIIAWASLVAFAVAIATMFPPHAKIPATTTSLLTLVPVLAVTFPVGFFACCISAHKNSKMKRKIEKTLLRDNNQIKIWPGELFSSIVFVRVEDYNPSFSITLHDTVICNKLIFNVTA